MAFYTTAPKEENKPVKNTPWQGDKPITTQQGKDAFEKVFIPTKKDKK